MTDEATRERCESELKDLLPDDDESPMTEEQKEIVDQSEQVSSEVDEYIYKSQAGSPKKKLTDQSGSGMSEVYTDDTVDSQVTLTTY